MKNKNEIRDAEAANYPKVYEIMYMNDDTPRLSGAEYLVHGFKAGFDCRDKLDNEALKLAVECLEKYKDSAFEINGKIYKIGNKAEAALAEIRKLRGDVE